MPLVVLFFYAAITLRVLWIGWRKVTVISRLLAGLLALTFMSIANFYFALELPFDLKCGGPEQGYVQDGHCYVGNHGRYIEVSPEFYHQTLRYERISSAVTITLLTVTILAFLIRVHWSQAPGSQRKPDFSS